MRSCQPVAPTIVVVDSTFLQHLSRPDSIAKIGSCCRTAGLQIYPSVPNVLEALKHPSDSIRSLLVRAIRDWLAGRPLLPWPPALLKLAGEALCRGNREFTIPSTDLNYLVDHPDRLAEDGKKASAFLDKVEREFSESFRDMERDIRAVIKAAKARGKWASVAEFLDDHWSDREIVDHFARVVWNAVEIARSYPGVDLVLQSEPWRLMLEGLGAAMYFRNVRHEKQGTPAGFVDLGQLVYLTAHTRSRILITNDDSLYETAEGILRGRYANARVMRANAFLAQAV